MAEVSDFKGRDDKIIDELKLKMNTAAQNGIRALCRVRDLIQANGTSAD